MSQDEAKLIKPVIIKYNHTGVKCTIRRVWSVKGKHNVHHMAHLVGKGIYCGCPTYADDMALLATSQTDLQIMIDVAAKYAFAWRYTFNATKSHILVFGESPISRVNNQRSRIWHLDGSPLVEVDSVKHLGITLSVNSST